MTLSSAFSGNVHVNLLCVPFHCLHIHRTAYVIICTVLGTSVGNTNKQKNTVAGIYERTIEKKRSKCEEKMRITDLMVNTIEESRKKCLRARVRRESGIEEDEKKMRIVGSPVRLLLTTEGRTQSCCIAESRPNADELPLNKSSLGAPLCERYSDAFFSPELRQIAEQQ